LISRNQKDLTKDYPSIARAVDALAAENVALEGEVVARDAGGHPSFPALQHRRTSALAIVYYGSISWKSRLRGQEVFSCSPDLL